MTSSGREGDRRRAQTPGSSTLICIGWGDLTQGMEAESTGNLEVWDASLGLGPAKGLGTKALSQWDWPKAAPGSEACEVSEGMASRTLALCEVRLGCLVTVPG